MTLKGSLETLPLTAILQFVSEKGDTGSVRIDDGTDEWFIYFDGGKIRLLTRGKEEDYGLDSYLQKFMFVARDDINECLRKASASGTRPETALMRAELATEDHLCAAVHVWTEDTLFELADLKKGEFEMMKGYRPREKTDGLVKSCEVEILVGEFLLELARRECEWVALIEDIPDDNVILEAADFGPDDLGSCMLPISWLSQTDLVDGTRTVAEILEETILSRFELYKFVADLKRRGLILVADREKLLANAEEALKRNDIDAAQKFFENVLSSHGEDLPLRIRYAAILEDNNVIEKAFEQFCEIGKCYFEKDEMEEAAEYYLKARVLRPESVIVRSLIADDA
jgi:tetratricopeptide (TPR) repeat protein